MQTLLDRVESEVSFERGSIDVRFQSNAHAAVWLGKQDHPSLRFSALSGSNHCGLSIIRMNLNGQRFGCVEKLEQQRKLDAGGVSAEQFNGILSD